MFRAKVGCNWPSSSGEEKIFIVVLIIFLVKGVTLPLYNIVFPLSTDALHQSWLKLAQWVWRRFFLNFIDVFSLLSPYGKNVTHACFVQSLAEICLLVQRHRTLLIFLVTRGHRPHCSPEKPIHFSKVMITFIIKLAQYFRRRRLSNFMKVLLQFFYLLSPIVKRCDLSY